jgi:hypothetical protein
MTVLQANQIVSWNAVDDGDPKIYSINGMTITLSSRKDHQDEDLSEPVLNVRAPNGKEYDLVGQSNVNASARFGVGTLDPAIRTNQIIFTSDSDGNHCCTEVSVLELAADGWKGLSIGSFSELNKLTDFPVDLDGDGVPDIIAVDDRFLGEFDGFGVVFLPPKVFNVRAGSVLDVSKETRFTNLYRADMEKAQKGCLAHINAACAAFVADAFRAGVADWAWQIMLRNYDANNGWLPNVCLVAEVNLVCPEGKQRKFANFPDALTWFLNDGGYITPVSLAGAQQVIPSNDDVSTRASEFVVELLRMWSEPNDPKLSRLDSLYADQVSYYGKQRPRQEVLADKRKFAARWPDRKYQLRPDTLSVNCDHASSNCRVEGIVDWQARSPARAASTSGTAHFLYSLASAGQTFMIITENSSVLERTAAPASQPLVLGSPVPEKQTPPALSGRLANIAQPAALDDEPPTIPNAERLLITAVEKAREAYAAGANDMARGAARPARAREICAVLTSPQIANWVGTIETLSSNSDGLGVLSVQIAEGVSIKTWNNALSDTDYHTLIDPGSSVFKVAVTLKEGQHVTFGGQFFSDRTDCIKESSLTLNGSLTKPEFIFSFSNVAPMQ